MPRVIHFDIPAEDAGRAKAFYEKALGWTITKWDGPMDYWLISTGGDDEPGINGGLATRGAPDEVVVITVGVDDVDAYVERVVGAGGSVVMPRRAIPGVGWLAYVKDTEGNVFGLMTGDANAA
jgi:predicted enzyme related to lactoylglutathione lyase